MVLEPVKHLQNIFSDQADLCDELGSPFMARLLGLFAQRALPECAVSQRLLDWEGDASHQGDVVPLRLGGALHALVLSNQSTLLVSRYPPNQCTDDELWDAVTQAIRSNENMILGWLDSAPQTNEVRRSAIIYAGLSCITEQTSLPLELLELGASAGLNSIPTRYAYLFDGQPAGDPQSPVQIEPDWRGESAPRGDPEVLSSNACDLNPLDVRVPEDKLRLLAYLWADQQDRVERTRAAILMLSKLDFQVDRMAIPGWLNKQLGKPVSGCMRVVYHTVVWQYLDQRTRKEAEAVIMQAASNATKNSPFAWLRLEADGGDLPGGAVSLSLWPQGVTRVIARADFHGRWIDWKGWLD